MKSMLSKTDVHLELWESFISVLKSYSAAASLGGTPHEVLVLTEHSVEIAAPLATLKMSFHPTIGCGSWSLSRGTNRFQDAVQPKTLRQGNFDLNLDGTITLDGTTVEMDFAAIQLVAELTHIASREEIEVPA